MSRSASQKFAVGRSTVVGVSFSTLTREGITSVRCTLRESASKPWIVATYAIRPQGERHIDQALNPATDT